MGFQFIKEKVHFLNMIRTEKILKYFFSVEYFFQRLFIYYKETFKLTTFLDFFIEL